MMPLGNDCRSGIFHGSLQCLIFLSIGKWHEKKLKRALTLRSKSMDWFLYDKDLRHESVNENKNHSPESRDK